MTQTNDLSHVHPGICGASRRGARADLDSAGRSSGSEKGAQCVPAVRSGWKSSGWWLAVLAVLWLPTVGGAVPAVNSGDVYKRNIKATCEAPTRDSFQLVLTNTAPKDRVYPYIATYYETTVATEPGFKPVVEFVSGTFRITVDRKFVRMVEVHAGDIPGYMDNQMVKPVVRNVGYFRDANLHQVKFKICSGPRLIENVTGRQSLVVDRLVFRVKVGKGGTPSGNRDALREDPWARPVLSQLAVNAKMVPSFSVRKQEDWSRGQDVVRWADRLREDSRRMPLVRLRCARPGIYRILPEDLSRLGIDPTKVDVANLRLAEGNKEIPLLVLPAAGSSPGWKALVFFSPGADMLKQPYRAYWLLNEPGRDGPHRITKAEVPTWAPDRGTTASVLSRTKSYFEFRNYNHVMPDTASHARWSWATIPQEEFREVDFQVPGAANVRGGGRLIVELTAPWRGDDQAVRIYWNHRLVKVEKVRGGRATRIACGLPSGSIAVGKNILGVEFPEPLKSRIPDTVELTNVELLWGSSFASADNAAPYSLNAGKSAPTGGAGTLRFDEGKSLGPDDLIGLDVTTEMNPSRLAFQRTGKAGETALVAPRLGTGTRHYWVATLDTALRPWKIERRNPPKLDNRNLGADYLAITVKSLEPGTERLLRLKRAEGMRAQMADVEDIYDTFGYGVKSSQTIKDFIKYAYFYWKPPKPYFVCFVGETSDFLADALGVPADIQPDLVPNFSWGNPKAQARGDYPYGYITKGDFVGDLAIGRISVANADQLKGAIDKIEKYQDSPPPGAWRARSLFFTDDEREFQDIADLVIADSPSSLSLPSRIFLNEYPYEPYFRYVERRTSEEATSDLIHRLDEGVATSLYLGHGGPNVMSSERLFYLKNIPMLRKGSPPTYLGSASCDTAWLDYPKAPFEVSIGEMMVKIPGRGAIGMFGPVSGASSSMHKVLFSFWYRGVVGERLRRTGDIALYAQNSYYINRNSTFVPDQYVLIGDPALPLPEPRGKGLSLDVSSKILLKGVAEKVHVKGRTTAIQYGWVDLSLRSDMGTPVVPDERIRLLGGQFETDLNVEGQPHATNLTLRADAMNEAEGKWEMGSLSMEVVDPVLTVDLTTDPPPSTRFQPGEFSRLIQTVTNDTDYELPRMHIRLLSLGLARPLTEKVVDLAPHQKWQESIGGKTPPGITRMELEVGRMGDGGLTALGRSDLTVRAPSPTRAVALAMAASGLDAFPRPDGKGTEFHAHIENLSDHDLKNLSVGLWEYTKNHDMNTTLTAMQKVDSIPAGDGVVLRMLSPRVFPLSPHAPVLRVVVLVRNDPKVKPSAEMPATVVFERDVVVLPHVNVMIVPGSVSLSRNHVTRDETMFISAEVENTGREPVHNVLVEAFLDKPWVRSDWIRPRPHNYDVRIPDLLPYQKARVRCRFDTPNAVIGSRYLYIVANSRRQFTEDTYDDNVGRAPFVGELLPNFALSPTDPATSPVLVRPGEPQDLYFKVADTDASRPTEATEVAVDAKSPDRDWTPVTTSVPLRSIGPGRSVLAHARWIPNGNETQVRVTVSPTRSFLEPVMDDNQAVFPVLSQVDARFGKADGEGQSEWSQRSIFHQTVFNRARIQPTDRIAYKRPKVESQTPVRFERPISQQGVKLAEAVDEKPSAGEWLYRSDGYFVTSAEGTPPPIEFHVKRPRADVEYYDFFFQVPSPGKASRGKYKGRVDVAFGDEKGTTLLDASGHPGFWCYGGRHRIGPDGVKLTFTKPKNVEETGVKGYLLIPAVGRLTSPAIRFKNGAVSFHAQLSGVTPDGTHIALFGRWGRLEGKEMKWDDWKQIASLPDQGKGPVEIKPKDEYFQWEARLYTVPGRSPELSNIVLIQR